MKKLILTLFLFLTLIINSQTITYNPDYSNFSNPERGLYKHTSTKSSSTYSFLNVSSLNGYRTNSQITLIWRVFVLDAFKTSPISQEFLNNIQTDLNTIRKSGSKCILRFDYTDSDNIDASKTQILSHIEQLKPILQSNEDVISSLEAGFIGRWGEWYYSSNFGTTNLTAQNLLDRKEVGLAIMGLCPNRMVAFRTPTIQKLIAGNATVTSPYDNSILSRTSAHNDCFLASSDDYGTYINTTTDYNYLEAQSKYTFTGGETCAVSSYSTCPNALDKMFKFHWSYLNEGYNPSVTSIFQNDGCYNELVRKLGYRFELINSSIANNSLTINLQNVGFGNVFNERKAYLVLRNKSTNIEYSFQLNTDVRLWHSGSPIQIVQNLNLDVPVGTYELFLNLPDPKVKSPLFSIQLANVGTWDSVKGYNKLNQTLTIDSGLVIPPPPPPPPPVVIYVDNYIIKVTNLIDYTIAVYNLNGKLVSITDDIIKLRRGWYIIKITDNKGFIYTQKIYKK